MIRGVIFDVDGTLLDSMPVWEHAGELYLQGKGKTAEEGLSEKLFCMSMEEGAVYMQSAYGLTDSTEAIVKGVADVIGQCYREKVQLKKGVRELVETLSVQGIKMVIATSGDRDLVTAAFERLGIAEYFLQIFTCTEVGAGKSKPDIFLRAAECMQTKPEETLVFEDAFHAARTAKEAGFLVAGVFDESSRNVQEEFRAFSDFYMEESMAEILTLMV